MWKLPLFKIHTDADDIKAVADVISRGTYWADGPEIAEFEKEASSYIGRKHAITFNNGTSALHALMLAYGIGPGDEVIVPSFTFISTANAPLFTGAKPIFVDIEPDTFGLDPEKVKEKITGRTKAIIPVHYGGHSCQIGALKDIAEENDILLLEDAAEAMGAKFGGRMVGTFGDAAMFSFCQNKIITTGEGGIVLTDDEELAVKLKLIRSHGRSAGDYFGSGGAPDYVSLGYNMRMPTICAALGISQLKKIDKIIGRRREIARTYNDALSGFASLTPPNEMENCRHVYQLYTILLDDHEKRDKLKEHLAKNGIMSKVYFEPIHLTEFYRNKYEYSEGLLPVTEDISKRVLTLPLFPGMSDEDIRSITDCIEEYIGE